MPDGVKIVDFTEYNPTVQIITEYNAEIYESFKE